MPRSTGSGPIRAAAALWSEASMMWRCAFPSAAVRCREMRSSALWREAGVSPFTGRTVSISWIFRRSTATGWSTRNGSRRRLQAANIWRRSVSMPTTGTACWRISRGRLRRRRSIFWLWIPGWANRERLPFWSVSRSAAGKSCSASRIRSGLSRVWSISREQPAKDRKLHRGCRTCGLKAVRSCSGAHREH